MKKIVCALLCISMLLGAVCISVSAKPTYGDRWFVRDETYTLGDVDGDGEQNGKDALSIKATVAGLEGYSLIEDAADFNGDGVVDAKDSYLMKTCLSGTNSFDALEGEYQIYKLTIGGFDISEYSIVIPERNDEYWENTKYSAEEMQKYVKEATGITLPVCIGEAETERVICYHYIEIDSAEAKEKGLELENYIYEVVDGDLHIWGTLRGNMYATYEILENHLGFRFYLGDYTYVYKNRTVDIPEDTYVYYDAPLDFRFVGQTFNHNPREYYFPRKANGSQLYDCYDTRYGTLTGPHFINAHSLDYYWRMGTGTMPDESYGSYGDRLWQKWNSGVQQDNLKWQPCASTESSYQILISGMLDTMAMIQTWSHVFRYEWDYVISSMSFSICDNGNYCTCRYCTKKVKTESYSGLYTDLANRALGDMQEVYSRMKVYLILYDHTVPQTVRPADDMILMYCGHDCNNHILGTNQCEGMKTNLGGNNLKDQEDMKIWAELCRETGTELWYWSYAVNYHYWLAPCPNVVDIYYNFNYIINECGFNGIYYEGGGETYNYEALKAYMASRYMWDPSMTYEEFTDVMKEFLYMYYGDGYEYIYEYIMMQNEAGDLVPCFVNNFDRPGDMMSYEYLAENYEYMRGLIVKALEMAEREECIYAVEKLLMCCEFMGLSSVYDDMYTNGDSKSRTTYEERYTWLYNFIKDNELNIFSDPNYYMLPESIDFSINPMTQFYEFGSRRPGVTP